MSPKKKTQRGAGSVLVFQPRRRVLCWSMPLFRGIHDPVLFWDRRQALFRYIRNIVLSGGALLSGRATTHEAVVEALPPRRGPRPAAKKGTGIPRRHAAAPTKSLQCWSWGEEVSS